MEAIKNMLERIRLRSKTEETIPLADKQRLAVAKRRAKRIEDLVVEYTGVEITALTGKDVK